MKQGALDLGHELVVDLFAGGGGASLGITWALGRGPDGKRLTKTAQVRLVGNSVPPQWAHALVAANFVHEREVAAE